MGPVSTEEFRLQPEAAGSVGARLEWPERTFALLVLAHGAGAGMRHPFLDATTERLVDRGIAVLRYQFPYMEKGRRRPDRAPRLQETVRAAVAAASERAEGRPVFAGGKSMGGRMTSLAESDAPLGIHGLVFIGFPLHAAGCPGTERGGHLDKIERPLLFLQGTRDKLAELELLRPICRRLGARAMLHEVEGGDHSFHFLKRSGRTDEQGLDELADVSAEWMRAVLTDSS